MTWEIVGWVFGGIVSILALALLLIEFVFDDPR